MFHEAPTRRRLGPSLRHLRGSGRASAPRAPPPSSRPWRASRRSPRRPAGRQDVRLRRAAAAGPGDDRRAAAPRLRADARHRGADGRQLQPESGGDLPDAVLARGHGLRGWSTRRNRVASATASRRRARRSSPPIGPRWTSCSPASGPRVGARACRLRWCAAWRTLKLALRLRLLRGPLAAAEAATIAAALDRRPGGGNAAEPMGAGGSPPCGSRADPTRRRRARRGGPYVVGRPAGSTRRVAAPRWWSVRPGHRRRSPLAGRRRGSGCG